ncbi:MAG: cytochrome-c peroxidase [Bacteroidia bacterium]
MRKDILYIIVFVFVLVGSCKKDVTTTNNQNPNTSGDTLLNPYVFNIPRFGPPYIYAPNPMTNEGVDLGRHLFFDPIISSNGRTCSTCHPQSTSFTTTYTAQGLNPVDYQDFGTPPILCNEAWKKTYGWNGVFTDMDHIAIVDLDAVNFPQFLKPNIDSVTAKIKANPYYSYMFRRVFKGRDIYNKPDTLKECISFALAQYVRTIVMYQSKFDKYMNGLVQLTPSEYNGYQIFFTERGDCFHCHGSYPLMTDNGFHNNGIDSVFTGPSNSGRYTVTFLEKDMGVFQSPTLRNIELTAPYMHDGRFATLEEVIEHYNSGVTKTPTIDPLFTLPQKAMGLQLSTQEKRDLKAFLLTLTDTTVLYNPAFSKPK